MDTNVISEIRKGARGHPGVAAWWQGVREEDLFLSVLTLGEIRRGIEGVRPRDPAKAEALHRWLAAVMGGFAARILPVDARVAHEWGRIGAGRSVPVIDGLIAATANVHGLVLVTRNVADVEGLGVRTLNPFTAEG
ncbi:type II toxin-antitoxin system VapC family toxin [Falsiroseomonas ponticola]|uniref:type II toxin-antitoxin system VapC family toxin n=1 Tax=Falsiroseomonas ponticola TaxID=2786951 RepID=UPI001931B9C5|nr:type II toxin-antitoxin system VapC family toxin [Roseomonas ponticola]